MLPDGFRFVYMEDEGYPLAFGKVMDNNTTLWQNRRFPFNVGCFIDIFPLDLTDIGMMSFGRKWMKYRLEYMRYRAKISHISFKGIVEDLRAKRFDTLRPLPMKIALMFTPKRKILQNLFGMEQTWNKPTGDRYVSFTETGMYMFPKAWFEEYIMVPFEDIEVRLPKRYDDYLTYIYGDYMTPPPPEQRSGDGPHGKIYVNLSENIPLSAIR